MRQFKRSKKKAEVILEIKLRYLFKLEEKICELRARLAQKRDKIKNLSIKTKLKN